jgi:drug/metabolite transporter (DMT)-like permease
MNDIHSQNQMMKAYVGMAMSTLIIGLSFVFVKIALRSAGPFDVLAHRFNAAVIALLLLYVTGVVRKPKLNRKQFLQLLSISVFYPLLFFGLQTIGLQYTTASEAGIMAAITPVITLLLASLVLKERNTIGQIMGVVLSVAGICYIFRKAAHPFMATACRAT